MLRTGILKITFNCLNNLNIKNMHSLAVSGAFLLNNGKVCFQFLFSY